MKLNIKEMVNALDDEEVQNMCDDLNSGSTVLKAMIMERMKQIESNKRKYCAGCGEELETKKMAYTLIFGPEDFKKKASFCAYDCLEYFLSKIRKAYGVGEDKKKAEEKIVLKEEIGKERDEIVDKKGEG